jgi:hypothetical protein
LSLFSQNCCILLVISEHPVVFSRIILKIENRGAECRIETINPILRGWTHYFVIGASSRCFGYVRDWVEKKVRRHLMRARKRSGFGWKRWSTQWLYRHLGLFGNYRVSRPKQLRLKALPV